MSILKLERRGEERSGVVWCGVGLFEEVSSSLGEVML